MLSLQAFLDVLEKSNLLSPEQLAQIRQQAPGAADAKSLAIAMIRAELLTKWQAEQLLGGKHQFFFGKYKVLTKLGEGGMGAVFQAQELRGLHRTVAIKVMSSKVLDNETYVRRFLREAEAVCKLSHPNIVSAFDCDQFGKAYMLVMEFFPGRDLKAWIVEHGRLPIGWACECIRQAACGLQYAHEMGLAHRDIKPANLLVQAESIEDKPLAKILDFGIARFVDADHDTQLTGTGQIMGTVDYMAPEQARSTKVADIRSDVYSLGCTLFHALTGTVPFDGESMTEKLVARVTDSFPDISKLRPEVPAGLGLVIATACARAPGDRFQTPAEFASALEPFTRAAAGDASDQDATVISGGHRAPTMNSGFPNLDEPQSGMTQPVARSETEFEFAVAEAATGPLTAPFINTDTIDSSAHDTLSVDTTQDLLQPQTARRPWWPWAAGAGALALAAVVGAFMFSGQTPDEPIARQTSNTKQPPEIPARGGPNKQHPPPVIPQDTGPAQIGPSPVKIFVLAGQSNMAGRATIQSMDQLLRDPGKAARFGHLKGPKGGWARRPDVWVKNEVGQGTLSLGWGERNNEFGPGVSFGWAVGEHFDNQVLILMITQGALALAREGRPPSSGGQTGAYYQRLANEPLQVVKQLKQFFSAYDGGGCEIAGLVWFQGWNDVLQPETVDEYGFNLKNLIVDLRQTWGTPDLPVVIGELGQQGPKPSGGGGSRVLQFRQSQQQVAQELKHVRFVETAKYMRPGMPMAFLYGRDPEILYQIGEDFGAAMVDMHDSP